ncbi:hypothetical protein ACNO8X_26520 [Mycobacterium sp. PDNC021]|uniref:hypothetical protein n=1 Tax=Mycobacterium sp. PDNC021 TaxID=3391399 RepID=UPI003AAD4A8A
MSDDINIDPGEVKASGQRLSELAGTAKAQTNKYFTSQEAAARGNPSFAAGPRLVEYANKLHNQMNSFIDDLAANGNKIVSAANNVTQTDSDTATGFSRELSSLNGLSQPAVASR